MLEAYSSFFYVCSIDTILSNITKCVYSIVICPGVPLVDTNKFKPTVLRTIINTDKHASKGCRCFVQEIKTFHRIDCLSS